MTWRWLSAVKMACMPSKDRESLSQHRPRLLHDSLQSTASPRPSSGMRIAILDRDPAAPTYPHDLAAHLVAAGAHVQPVIAAQLAVTSFGNSTSVTVAGQPLLADVVLTRAVALLDDLIGPALSLLEQQGVWICNPPAAASIARDKVRTAIALASSGVRAVPTIGVACAPARDIERCLTSLNGPLVIKPAVSGGGVGVVKVPDATAAVLHLERLSNRLDFTDQELVIASACHYVVQPFIPAGRDYRVFVIDGQAVAMSQRTANEKDFRTNGPYALSDHPYWDDEFAALGIQATAALGLDYAGVDVIEVDGRPAVLEVNGWPGYAKTAMITGVDIAGLLAAYLLTGHR